MRMKSVNSQRTPVTQVQVTIDIEKTGEQLKIITKEKGYEVRDLVALTGYSSQAVYKWFNGKSLPSIDTLVVLSKVLNMEINELLVIDGEFDFFGKSPRRILPSVLPRRSPRCCCGSFPAILPGAAVVRCNFGDLSIRFSSNI